MKITIAVDAETALTFDSPEAALSHLVELTAHSPNIHPHDDRLQVLADRFTLLTNARSWWRRALEHYKAVEMEGYANPAVLTMKAGYSAFRSPEEARIQLARLDERIEGIRAEIAELLDRPLAAMSS